MILAQDEKTISSTLTQTHNTVAPSCTPIQQIANSVFHTESYPNGCQDGNLVDPLNITSTQLPTSSECTDRTGNGGIREEDKERSKAMRQVGAVVHAW